MPKRLSSQRLGARTPPGVPRRRQSGDSPAWGIPPRGRRTVAGSRRPVSPPGPGQGACPPGPSTCAPRDPGVPGAAPRARDLSPEPKESAGRRGGGKEQREGAGGRREGVVTSVHRPHAAEGVAGPRPARSLSLHLAGMRLGAGRAGGSALGDQEPERGCRRLQLARGAAPGEEHPDPGSGPGSRPGSRPRLAREATRLPSRRPVFIGFPCSQITGFPHCFLLFIRRHGNPWTASISKTKGFPANFTLRNP